MYPILFLGASLLLALFDPMLLLIFYAGAFVLLMLSRQLNLYRMVMVLKRYARNLGAKLRCDIRARMHLGLRDYRGASLDEKEGLHRRTRGYVR